MFCLLPIAWVTNHSSAWSSRSCSGWWSRRRSRCSLKPSSLPPNAPSSVALKVWEEPRYLGQRTAEEWWPRWAWPCPLSNPQEFSPVPPLRTVLPNRRRSRGRRREPTIAPCPEASSGLFNLWTLQGPEWRKLQHWLTGKRLHLCERVCACLRLCASSSVPTSVSITHSLDRDAISPTGTKTSQHKQFLFNRAHFSRLCW